jgi:excisionase family DNA binding protein
MASSGYRFGLANDSLSGMSKVLQALESKEQALKAGELAKLLGVTRQHIYKMAATGDIPSFRVGRAVRFDPKQVVEWLQRKMPQPVPRTRQDRVAV